MKCFLAACLLGGLALAASPAGAQTVVKDPWIRATVGEQSATGLFAEITSVPGGKLIAANSPVAGVVEIHQMAMEGNVMKMRAVSGLELPAGRPVSLKPGGYHLMLLDLKKPLRMGESVPVTLVVESANGKRESIEIAAPVKQMAGARHDAKH